MAITREVCRVGARALYVHVGTGSSHLDSRRPRGNFSLAVAMLYIRSALLDGGVDQTAGSIRRESGGLRIHHVVYE